MLTFLITVYNKEPYIERVLESVRNQSFSMPCEYIVVNDGSTDRSLEIIKEKTKDWINCKIINQENLGVVWSTINAIELAEGDFIKFVDGDDFLLPSITEEQMKIIVGNDCLSYVSCSFGCLIGNNVVPKYRAEKKIADGDVTGSIYFFHDEEALLSILTRKGSFTEALTGMSGGLSRKNHINIEKAKELASKYHLRQMQDHLISSMSLLGRSGSYAHINNIGFYELSKSSSADIARTLSFNSDSGLKEQVLINYDCRSFLSDQGKIFLMKTDLKKAYRSIFGKKKWIQAVNPFSRYRKIRRAVNNGDEKSILYYYEEAINCLTRVD